MGYRHFFTMLDSLQLGFWNRVMLLQVLCYFGYFTPLMRVLIFGIVGITGSYPMFILNIVCILDLAMFLSDD